MQFTLKSAKDMLAAAATAYGGRGDLRAIINRAIQSLSGMAGWERLRKILRFSAVGPHFVLPQGCAGIVRACLNGHPAHVRAQDFRFIHSGPGELARPPSGFCPVRTSNIIDIGMKPVMFEPRGVFRLFATVPAETDLSGVSPVLTVRGLTPGGAFTKVSLTPEATDDPGTATPDDTQFQMITEVTLSGFPVDVSLFAYDTLTEMRYPVGYYHKGVEAPEFRHYEIAGVAPAQPIELLVECRIDPLPLVDDTDIVPLPSLNPIEWVIHGNWKMAAGETEAAQKYYGMAANWLRSLEVVENTAQTSVVVNSVFENSPGEISMEAVNI